jgi:hypothetical protein
VKARASDRLELLCLDPDFLGWCSLAIDIFKSDADIRREFDDDVIAFFDFAVECSNVLIDSIN